MGTLDGMSAVIAGGPAAGALIPLVCVLFHAWRQDGASLSPVLLNYQSGFLIEFVKIS